MQNKWSIYLFLILADLLKADIAWAGKAQITVLSAALYKTTKSDAPIIEYKRRGDIIYIKDESIYAEDDSVFYQTLDGMGNEAFILKNEVLLTFPQLSSDSKKDLKLANDSYEKKNKKEYRKLEPLPPQYPLAASNKLKAIIAYQIYDPFIFTPTNETVDNSSITPSNTTHSLGTQFRIGFGKRANFDLSERLYFLIELMYGHQLTNFNFSTSTNTVSNESIRLSTIGIAPSLSFDAIKKTHWSVSTELKFFLNYAEAKKLRSGIIEQKEIDESLFYQGALFFPQLSVGARWTDFIPDANLHFFCNYNLMIPQSLSLSSEFVDIESSTLYEVIPSSLDLELSSSLGVGLSIEFTHK